MHTKKKTAACLLSFALLLGMIPTNEVSATEKTSLNTKELTVITGKSQTLKVKNSKKRVTWKILSGKKYITLKKKSNTAVTIKGKNKGSAKVRATIGKTKLTCEVTVKNPLRLANIPEGADEQDVAALQKIIEKQLEQGAGRGISEDLNSKQYKWENGKLTKIYWNEVSLSGKLNVSGCVNLTSLDCSENSLNSLDVSGCSNLTFLNCSNNQLKRLDVSACVNLTRLFCTDNQLKRLNLTNNKKLDILGCSNNQLKRLNLTNNKKLTTLSCDNKVTVIGYNK